MLLEREVVLARTGGPARTLGRAIEERTVTLGSMAFASTEVIAPFETLRTPPVAAAEEVGRCAALAEVFE